MADTKTSALTAATTVDPADLVMTVDVSDTTMAASGTNKKATREQLQTYAAGTLTTDKKIADYSATWNNAAVAFTGVKVGVTDTASDAASLLADLQVGGASKLSVSKAGAVTAAGAVSGTTLVSTVATGTAPLAVASTTAVTNLNADKVDGYDASAFVQTGGALGTPTSGTLTNCTGLPVGGVSGLGTGVGTALAVNTGSAGAFVVNGGALGTPSSGTLTNATALPLSTGVTGTLPVSNGGTGATSFTDGQLLIGNSTGNTLSKSTLTAGSGISITNGAGAITIAASGGGTVTSVSQTFTGGLVSVSGSPITNSGTLALTVAGTSGGVPYFSSASAWASSAALAANALVIGGGAGAAPSTITTGTGVVTALGVNAGSSGAFVVNGGALGTPSSGTVTNLTGTASININGTVGATTATTGAFTTVTSSGGITISKTTTATVGGSTTDQFQIQNNSSGGALMGFHRVGAYAINLGLDTDNVFRLGGWSNGANTYRWTSDTSGNFVAQSNVTAYSDIRLKKDLAKIENALDKVKTLTGYTFTRIDTDQRQTGLIAQDVQKVLPEAVMDDGERLSLAYGHLAGLLVEAIKELKSEVDALKARNGA